MVNEYPFSVRTCFRDPSPSSSSWSPSIRSFPNHLSLHFFGLRQDESRFLLLLREDGTLASRAVYEEHECSFRFAEPLVGNQQAMTYGSRKSLTSNRLASDFPFLLTFWKVSLMKIRFSASITLLSVFLAARRAAYHVNFFGRDSGKGYWERTC